jgi:leishmanolysin-like peptidase
MIKNCFFLQNEAMTGTHTQNPIYSRITMALMEDTGWYLPNYDMADDFKWGRDLGCDFAVKSCLEWMERRQNQGLSIHPFCNKVKRDPLETECTDDRSSVALCNLVQHPNELPPDRQVQRLSLLKILKSRNLNPILIFSAELSINTSHF